MMVDFCIQISVFQESVMSSVDSSYRQWCYYNKVPHGACQTTVRLAAYMEKLMMTLYTINLTMQAQKSPIFLSLLYHYSLITNTSTT